MSALDVALHSAVERRAHRYRATTPNPSMGIEVEAMVLNAVRGLGSTLPWVVDEAREDLAVIRGKLNRIAADPGNPPEWTRAARRLAATVQDVLDATRQEVTR